MNKNKLPLITALAISGVLILGLLFNDSYNSDKFEIILEEPIATINDTVINLELVSTMDEQIKGLSYRNSLDYQTGMLFTYDDYEVRTFWMKEMYFPIDIIWIKDDTIVGIVQNAPIPVEPPIPTFTSPEAVNYVLEVNANFAQENNIKVGDKINFNFAEYDKRIER